MALGPPRIFIDTGALVAYFREKEQWHSEVKTAYKNYQQLGVSFLTTNYVLGELFTWASRIVTVVEVRRLVEGIQLAVELGELRVLYADAEIDRRAREILVKFFEHRVSFPDAVTYLVCKDFKIDEVFTLDEDFRKMGLVTAPNIRG
ncbi:MAG: Nucleic acid-binding protein [Microgenomates group bacterium GW2011_GWA1_48_10]|uniref:PIN domain-containing protein n=1 Tax=Candidatus Gottesmanbacteria bacterium RIFCSPHIGHO2_01_FULL_47_48 TaxID=1798381 RepID=A0A1F6A4T3_9BACT|nr:MAG: Nucleic acid-binding protein [Microgenomates group bacterium GW2011_GWA1_48_10]OGG19646.1 MAG: hypothetical protein A2721_00835 [Candidatus Gottesmanbacteria bacterium RIFCSPHIGHO2_01_FULL_47_48]